MDDETKIDKRHENAGRPKLAPEMRKAFKLVLTFTAAEYDALINNALSDGLGDVKLSAEKNLRKWCMNRLLQKET